MMKEPIEIIDFEKGSGLVPAIVQDVSTRKVLMLGYMNREALEKTYEIGKVTFFSRSKNRLWTKGEESGNFLELVEVKVDCDKDTLLVYARPVGPVCHTGSDTCFDETNASIDFLYRLEEVIQARKDNPSEGSYTTSLFNKGVKKIAQKVGEEAVELILEAQDDQDELFLAEAADLMYHYLVLLAAKGFTASDVVNVLKERHEG